ncbi:MAG: PIN domain-containing protein [Defluviitaleaceae bacterium]|nr:PIN domain-containing protein [Defluviitaleaceae bacterium]
MGYAMDSSIIIDFLNREPLVIDKFDKAVINGIGIIIPSVVDYEVLRGFCHKPTPLKETVYNKLRINCPVVEVDATIWKRAASIWATLRKMGKTVGDADIIIAACCIENGYTLVTHNTKHFIDISELMMDDWPK